MRKKSPGLAQEAVKYITKQFGDGWDLGGEKPNRITKSTTWLRVSDEDSEEGESGPCEYCDDYPSALRMMAWPFTRPVVRPVYAGVRG